jgi:hypothetical protein
VSNLLCKELAVECNNENEINELIKSAQLAEISYYGFILLLPAVLVLALRICASTSIAHLCVHCCKHNQGSGMDPRTEQSLQR